MQGIDHIVIAVRDLAAASDDYARLGFTVTPGGEHTGGATHNALISFADGAYFELIAFREPDRPQDHKWWGRFAKGEGTVDFALLSESVDFEGDRLMAGRDRDRRSPRRRSLATRRAAHRLAQSRPQSRRRAAAVHDRRCHQPRSARPDRSGDRARAGCHRDRRADPAGGDLDRATAPYQALLDTPGESSTPTIEAVRRARRFRSGSQWIELAEADSERGGSAAAHRGARGRSVRDRPGRRGGHGAITPRSDARGAHPGGGHGDEDAIGGAGRSRSR